MRPEGNPVCGGGNGARSQVAWQMDFLGIDAINCEACLEILTGERKKHAQEA